MSKELLLEYGRLKLQVKKNEELIEAMQPDVLAFLQKIEDQKPVSIDGLGIFSLVNRKVWKYTPKVDELKKALDDRKAEEQALGPENGGAEVEIVQNVMFKVPKE